MKALDTNLLVRYLVQDDPAQGRKQLPILSAQFRKGEQILISNIVLCETVWVLDAAYEYAKPVIESALERILQTGIFRFEAKDVVFAAFEEYRNSKVDFADCLIGRVHASLGSEPTATFDTALKRLATFELL